MSDVEKAQQTDIPITDPEQDRLDRARYAEAISNFIYNAPTIKEHSQIAAIYGPWGEGKSSLKNMACKMYAVLSSKKVGENSIIVNFNPWVYSNNDNLPYLFFHTIADGFRNSKESSIEKASRSAVKSTEDIATLFEILGLSASAMAIPFAAFAGIPGPQAAIFLCLSGLLAFWGKISKAIKRSKENISKSLDVQKEELKKILADKEQRVLVVIEDLDRVSPAEIRSLITLVKANGDFPYITYLLVGDRDYIAKALTEKSGGEVICDGYDYLKKIVALEFDLPTLSKQKIYEELMLGLCSIRDDLNLQNFHPEMDFPPNLRSFFHNLRDVKRFLNAFQFRLEYQKAQEGSALGIVFSELLNIEVCRMFENKLYLALREAKDLLTQDVDPVSLHKTSHSKSTIEELFFKKISSPTNEVLNNFVSSILRDLFGLCPDPTGVTKDYIKIKDANPVLFKIRNPDRFDNYFLYPLGDCDYTGKDDDDFKDSLYQVDTCVTILNRLLKNQKIYDFFQEKQLNLHENNSTKIQNFITALFCFGETATDTTTTIKKVSNLINGRFKYDLTTEILRTIVFIAEKACGTETISHLFLQATNYDKSLIVIPAKLLFLEMSERSEQGKKRFTDTDFEDLRREIAWRILSLQQEGRLIGYKAEKEIRITWYHLVKNFEFEKAQMVAALRVDFLKYPEVFHAIVPCLSYSSNGNQTWYTVGYDSLSEISDPKAILGLLKTEEQKGVLKDKTEKDIMKCLEFCIKANAEHEPYGHDDQMRAIHGRAM